MQRKSLKTRQAEVLLVEDNVGDVMLAREGFKEAGYAVNIHHLVNGESCLKFLRKEGEHAGTLTPDLVLLDLNLPRMDGREVLAEIVKDEYLRRLPVIVLSSSLADDDVSKMYDLRCNSYFLKPLNFSEFVEVISTICDYWLNRAVLPPQTR